MWCTLLLLDLEVNDFDSLFNNCVSYGHLHTEIIEKECGGGADSYWLHADMSVDSIGGRFISREFTINDEDFIAYESDGSMSPWAIITT